MGGVLPAISMKNLLVTKLYSRLGLKYVPHGGAEFNIGVEHGPDAVLAPLFLETLKQLGVVDIFTHTFPNPDRVSKSDYYAVIAKESDSTASEIGARLNSKKYSGLITVGGDHSIAFASTLAVLRFFKGKKVGIIDFDSHGDIHLTHTSPSGNFHGMWLRPFLEHFDNNEITKVVDVVVPAQHVLYIGNLLLEDEEAQFIRKNKITVFDSQQCSQNDSLTQKKIAEFCKKFDYIHVSFDIDVFKEEIVHATGTPNPQGFNSDEIMECIETIIQSRKLFSLDIVEVNPEKEGSLGTIKTAQEVITAFLPGFTEGV